MSGRNLSSSQVSCPDVDRVKRIDVRVSPEEKAAIEKSAGAAGVSPAEFVRSRALAEGQVRAEAAGGSRGASDAGALGARSVSPRASEELRPPAPPDLKSLLRFGCPVHGCGMRAGSAKAVCGAHGRRVVER